MYKYHKMNSNVKRGINIYVHYPLKRGDEVDEEGVRKENGVAKNLA